MPLTHSALQTDLTRAVTLFAEHPDATEMPFMHSFPKNACERCAALLCVALKRKYPESKVSYIRGRSSVNSEMHFWVEADQFVLDPTAHQFEEYSEPLLCLKPSPLELVFGREHETTEPEGETDLPRNSNGKWQAVLAALTVRIEA